jgi:hypothetical protein
MSAGGRVGRLNSAPSPPKVPKTEVILARTPYRCAVGLMIKTDEVSEQLCTVVAAGGGQECPPHYTQPTPETVWVYYGLMPEQAKVDGLNPKRISWSTRPSCHVGKSKIPGFSQEPAGFSRQTHTTLGSCPT